MLSRRAFLVGGAAAIVGLGAGTAAGTTTPPGRRLLHRAGLLEGDDHPPPDLDAGGRPTIEYGSFVSERMRRPVPFAIALPHAAPGPLPVVFCLHGRGGDERFAVETIRVQDYLADAGIQAAVASVDGGSSSYWHPRLDGTDALGMLVDEFVPRVDDEVGNGTRALLGWSMGGYGALLAAERHPDRFVAVAAASPALWRRPEETAPGAFDGDLDFKAHSVFTAAEGLDDVAVRIDCGEDDPFLGAAEAFAALVPHADLAVRPGFHDSAYWRSVADDQVEHFRLAFA